MTRSALFLQAIRGPVLLITIGTLFAMQQADVVSVGRTWPLILIVLGVLKLLERIVLPSSVLPSNSNVPPPGGLR